MATFTEFTNQVYDEIDNKNSDTLTRVKQATVRCLKEVSSIPVLFMEETFSFATIASQEAYTVGHTGFPNDARVIYRVYYESGSARYEIPMASMDVARFHYSNLTTTQYPEGWAWFEQSMYLFPKPSGIVTIKGDYQRDATRDSSSGAVITTASTTQTNGWLDRGETAMRWRVMAEIYKLPSTRDQEAAAFCDLEYNRAVQILREEWHQTKHRGGQAVAWMGEPLEGGTAWPGGSWY